MLCCCSVLIGVLIPYRKQLDVGLGFYEKDNFGFSDKYDSGGSVVTLTLRKC